MVMLTHGVGCLLQAFAADTGVSNEVALVDIHGMVYVPCWNKQKPGRHGETKTLFDH